VDGRIDERVLRVWDNADSAKVSWRLIRLGWVTTMTDYTDVENHISSPQFVDG